MRSVRFANSIFGAVLLASMSFSICAATVDAQSVASSSAPASTLAPLLAQLRGKDVVKTSFVQEKTSRLLKRPLQSTGELLFVRGRGMIWRVAAPMTATYVVDAQGMREASAAPSSTSSSSAMPNLMPVFDAVFSGDEAQLARYFKYSVKSSYSAQSNTGNGADAGDGGTARWQLHLVPREGLLQKIFSELQLAGGDYITQITLIDTRGDYTRISLGQPTLGEAALNANDRALLP